MTDFKQHYGTGTDPFALFESLPIEESDTGLTVFLRCDIIKRMFRLTSKDQIKSDLAKCRDELDRLEQELLT